MPVSYPGFKGGDRTNIELPAVQRNCLKALKEAGKRIVYVNCSGSALALTPETESCDAILQAWYPGESGGQAVADVLFGDFNPSGKLPVTFYRSSEQLGDFEDYSMKGKTYRYMSDPLFPFGYGLSYTTFGIGSATVSKTTFRNNETIQITIPVVNTGNMSGTEVVQVYTRKVDDLEGPIKTLKAFKRVELDPGEAKQVTIDLPPSTFEFYNWNTRTMQVSPDEYEIYYGSSSDPADLKITRITIQ
jgi:beta-glucosidase